MFNQFTFSLIFSDYFQKFIFLSSNKYSTRKNLSKYIYKNLNLEKFDVMKVSRILKTFWCHPSTFGKNQWSKKDISFFK